MQQMLKTKKDEDDTIGPHSAFHSVGCGKSPSFPGVSANKRDSGYGTETSPASVSSATSTTRTFTYDAGVNLNLTSSPLADDGAYQEIDQDMDLARAIEEMDMHGDVFDSDRLDEQSENLNNDSDDDDDTDKEVEELTTDADRPVSQPIQIQRPSAPIPTPDEECDGEDCDEVWSGVGDDDDDPFEGPLISLPFHHTRWKTFSGPRSRERYQRNRFRPIVSRSVGTQTPSPHREAAGTGRFRPYARGASLARLRIRSETDENESVLPLPDLVPPSRDRSISLPDVPSFEREAQEREVGRELRRISDEFNSSFTRVGRRRRLSEHAASFPLRININFYAYWDNLRRIWSSSPIARRNNTETTEDRPNAH